MEPTEFHKLKKRIETAAVSSVALGWFYIILILPLYILSRINQYVREIIPLTLVDIVLLLSISFILIVLGNRIKKQIDKNTEKYLKILTWLVGIWVVIGILFGSGVGIILLILLFYYFRALGAVKRLKQADEHVLNEIPEYKIKKVHWTIFAIISVLLFFAAIFAEPFLFPTKTSESTTEDWVLLQSEEDSFKVMFPQAPQKKTGVQFLKINRENIKYHYTEYSSTQTILYSAPFFGEQTLTKSTYAIQRINYPLEIKDHDKEALLKEFLDDIVLGSTANELISSKITNFNTYKALDFIYSYNNIFYTYGKMIATDNSLYRLIVTYYKERYYSPEEFNYFMDSFGFIEGEVKVPEIEGEVKALEEVAEDETADWKTYRSIIFGFEVKYPSDWSFSGEGGVPSFYIKYTEGPSPIPWKARLFFDKTSVQTMDEYVADRFGPTTNNKIISTSNINLDALTGKEIVYSCKDCEVKYISEYDIYLPGNEGKVILFYENGNTFIIWFYYYHNDSRVDYYLKTLNQMLSTFRFLE